MDRKLKEVAAALTSEARRRIATGGKSGGGFIAVEVSQEEYDAWMAVEVAQGESDIDDRNAIRAYARVQKRLQAAESGTAGRAIPVPPRVAAIRPAKLPAAEIIEYSARRAVDLGVAAAAVWAKDQGARSEEAARVKNARQQIVVELRDRGATRSDIGAVFGGRKKQSIEALETEGRKRRDAMRRQDIQHQLDLAQRAKEASDG